MSLKEDELIQKARQGNREAFLEIYSQNFDSLFRYVRYKTNGKEDAEDICAESFVRAFETIHKFRGEASFKTYLYSIARNLLKDYYKNRSQEVNILDESKLIDKDSDNHSKEFLDGIQREVQGLLKLLNETEEQVIRLRYLSNQSIKQTAVCLGISESNTKVIAHRALAKLQQSVK